MAPRWPAAVHSVAWSLLLCAVVMAEPSPMDPDWQELYREGHLLFSSKPVPHLPYIGNGYLATYPVDGPTTTTPTATARAPNQADDAHRAPGAAMAPPNDAHLFVSGVFNGAAVVGNCTTPNCPAPNRAVIPKRRHMLPGHRAPGAGVRLALDMRSGVFLRRWSAGLVRVEERWYAHAVRRTLLVHEMQIANPSDMPATIGPLVVEDSMTSPDINFTTVQSSDTVVVIEGQACGPYLQCCMCRAGARAG